VVCPLLSDLRENVVCPLLFSYVPYYFPIIFLLLFLCPLLFLLCFGTHGEAGSRFAERMLTVTATLRQQGRGVVDYVTSSIEASLRGEHPQSLLPMTAAKVA